LSAAWHFTAIGTHTPTGMTIILALDNPEEETHQMT
jgi:hypothetical protein